MAKPLGVINAELRQEIERLTARVEAAETALADVEAAVGDLLANLPADVLSGHEYRVNRLTALLDVPDQPTPALPNVCTADGPASPPVCGEVCRYCPIPTTDEGMAEYERRIRALLDVPDQPAGVRRDGDGWVLDAGNPMPAGWEPDGWEPWWQGEVVGKAMGKAQRIRPVPDQPDPGEGDT